MKQNIREKKRFIQTLAVLAGAALLIGGAGFAKSSIRRYNERIQTEALAAQQRTDLEKNPEAAQVLAQGGENKPVLQPYVEYNGQRYEKNPNIRTVLLLGIDRNEPFAESYLPSDGGQSDAIMLMIRDVTTGKVKLLMIPRDTMTDIMLYDLAGNYVGWGKRNLTLAFAYGRTPEESSKQTASAVSKLLLGVSTDDYLAITAQALTVLNDRVGGVKVKIQDEFLAGKDEAFVYGEAVTLKGEQARKYLSIRDISTAHTAMSRMERHSQYIQGWLETAKAAVARDEQLVVRLMEEIQDNMATNMPKDQYLKMGMNILESYNSTNRLEILTLPGESHEGENFDEFHPDEAGIKQLIIAEFYRPVDK